MTGSSNANPGPVARHPQEVDIKQLNRMWLHAVALSAKEELLVKNVLKGYGIVKIANKPYSKRRPS